MTVKKFFLSDEKAMMNFGGVLAKATGEKNIIIFLTGQLGAGKTTLVRGFLQTLGHVGAVKSPTYTLLEPYELQMIKIFHFDFYRLKDPEELEFIGIQDYFSEEAICLIEWPEQGGNRLPVPDLTCSITLPTQGREICIEAKTERGRDVLARI